MAKTSEAEREYRQMVRESKQARTRLQANYSKLRSGDWGVRVYGRPTPGEVVTVRTKAGGEKAETVKNVLWTGEGVTLCEIEER